MVSLRFLLLLSLSCFYVVDVCFVLLLSTHGIQIVIVGLPVNFPGLTAIYLWSCTEVLVAGRLLRRLSRSPRFKAKQGLRAQ